MCVHHNRRLDPTAPDQAVVETGLCWLVYWTHVKRLYHIINMEAAHEYTGTWEGQRRLCAGWGAMCGPLR